MMDDQKMLNHFPELTADENKIIDKARESGYKDFFPSKYSITEARRTLAGAKRFLAKILIDKLQINCLKIMPYLSYAKWMMSFRKKIMSETYNAKAKIFIENQINLIGSMVGIRKKTFYEKRSLIEKFAKDFGKCIAKDVTRNRIECWVVENTNITEQKSIKKATNRIAEPIYYKPMYQILEPDNEPESVILKSTNSTLTEETSNHFLKKENRMSNKLKSPEAFRLNEKIKSMKNEIMYPNPGENLTAKDLADQFSVEFGYKITEANIYGAYKAVGIQRRQSRINQKPLEWKDELSSIVDDKIKNNNAILLAEAKINNTILLAEIKKMIG